MPWLLVTTVALTLALLPEAAQAQGRDCNLLESDLVQESIQGGFSIITFTGRFAFRCADGTELRADFGTLNETTRELFLRGNVFYRDPERQLTSQQARYSSAVGRLHATGDVIFTDLAEGSSLRGPEVEYFRTMPGRPLAQVVATGRPHVTLLPRSQQGTDTEPLAVDGDRVTIVGEDQFSAVGRVVIRRSNLDANANQARFDGVRELLELRGSAEVRGEQFNLSAETIDAVLPQGGIERVLARQQAALVGEDLRVNAPELQLFFVRDSLQRMVARGAAEPQLRGRAIAISSTFRLEADSLDTLLPGQRLEQVIAVGNARGEALDTTRAGEASAANLIAGAVSTDRDWLTGDTIIGFFSPVPPAPPGDPVTPAAERAPGEGEVQLDRLVARGSARSLYRVPPSEGNAGDGRFALNYLVGDTIELRLSSGELELANVTGLQRGVYLEPNPPPAAEEVPPATENAPPATAEQVADRLPQRRRP